MTFLRVAWRFSALALLCLGLSGCFPPGNSQLDELKEPYFLRGKSLVTQSDFKGAVEAFEEALKVNPDSAAAHYELAVLYENREIVADAASAIYHYQRFLKLRPKANNADVVNTHIGNCKLELARTASVLPLTPSMQKDFDKLMTENRDLKKTVVDLKTIVGQWEAAYNNLRAATPSGNPVSTANRTAVTNVTQPPPQVRPASNPPPATAETPRVLVPNNARPGTTVVTNRSSNATASRVHTVKQGEVPHTIAHRYGISVDALMAANPQANARQLKPGQTLVIPTH